MIPSEIGTPQEDSEDFDYREGHISADVVEDDQIVVRFYVDGDQVASAVLDRFKAGVFVGLITSLAEQAA